MHAAINSDENLTNILWKYNADANIRDKEMKSALVHALEQDYENLTIIENLALFTDLKLEGPNCMNLLQIAIKLGHLKSLVKLLEKGAPVDQISKNTGIFWKIFDLLSFFGNFLLYFKYFLKLPKSFFIEKFF